MSALIDFGNYVSLQQAASLIVASPNNIYLLEGEPGIGKSSLLTTIQEMNGNDTAYIDVPNMDLGDIAMPVVNHESKTTGYYPNSRFKFHLNKPINVMLDEFTKGADAIKNMLHPLLEVVNPRLGDVPVPAGSIIFLTGNLSTDGVGDSLKAHSRNRIIPVRVRKPDYEQWLEWAVNNNIDPVIMAWVRQYPHALASYMDEGQNENPYIFNPTQVQTAFVSPRSLEKLSNITRIRSKIDADTLICAMKGAAGEAAARDIQAFVDYQDQLPKWEEIIKSPTTTEVPTSAGACAVMVFGAIEKIDKSSITPFMEYLDRFESEWQAAFAINIAKTPTKQAIAFSSNAFADWIQRNEDIL